MAGAGSGKTRVLTQRIAHLIAPANPAVADPAITFTNKAADEMRRRVMSSSAVSRDRMWLFATFHSPASDPPAAGEPRLQGMVTTIYDDADSRRLIEIILGDWASTQKFPAGAAQAGSVTPMADELIAMGPTSPARPSPSTNGDRRVFASLRTAMVKRTP